MVSELIPAVAGQFKDINMIDKVIYIQLYAFQIKEFYNKHQNNIFEKDFLETISRIKINVAWYNRNRKSIQDFLKYVFEFKY